MGIGQSAGDLVSAWVTRCYSKLRFALSRRHGSSPAASAATNNDVSATGRWRSSHAVCSARARSLLETAISQLTPFLRHRRDANRSDAHVQPRLARAGTALGNHWLCVGLHIAWMILQDIVKLGLYRILDPAHSWKRWLFEPMRNPAADTQKAAR